MNQPFYPRHLLEIEVSNPCLPSRQGNFILLPAYNLRLGATFMVPDEPDPRIWVVERVVRDVSFERVSLWCHDAAGVEGLEPEQAFNLDFQTPVALIGLVVNETDPDDNDWGTN